MNQETFNKEGKIVKKPPFNESSNIIDCNQQSGHTGQLSKKNTELLQKNQVCNTRSIATSDRRI